MNAFAFDHGYRLRHDLVRRNYHRRLSAVPARFKAWRDSKGRRCKSAAVVAAVTGDDPLHAPGKNGAATDGEPRTGWRGWEGAAGRTIREPEDLPKRVFTGFLAPRTRGAVAPFCAGDFRSATSAHSTRCSGYLHDRKPASFFRRRSSERRRNLCRGGRFVSSMY